MKLAILSAADHKTATPVFSIQQLKPKILANTIIVGKLPL
jgi:hypothetical protein